MIFELLLTLYIFIALFLSFIILVQKGKGSMGLGNLGGSTQLLFGGSGGQDLFQKITWFLGAIFIGGSLVLSLMKTKQYETSRYLTQMPAAQQQPITQPQPVQAPLEEPAQAKKAEEPLPTPKTPEAGS